MNLSPEMTELLKQKHKAGDTVTDLADYFGISKAEVREILNIQKPTPVKTEDEAKPEQPKAEEPRPKIEVPVDPVPAEPTTQVEPKAAEQPKEKRKEKTAEKPVEAKVEKKKPGTQPGKKRGPYKKHGKKQEKKPEIKKMKKKLEANKQGKKNKTVSLIKSIVVFIAKVGVYLVKIRAIKF